jgi:hypothetical protein
MATAPKFLKVLIQALIDLLINSDAFGLKKIKPLLFTVITMVLTLLLWIFHPDVITNLLKFIVSLF